MNRVGIFVHPRWSSASRLATQLEGALKGKVGEVTDVSDKSFFVTAQGGRIEVLRARGEDGKKLSGGDFARAAGLATGTILGS